MNGSVVKPLAALALAATAVPCVTAQSVISARSGLIHFFEGDVYVAGQRLQMRSGRFENIPDGAEIRTGQGRAEILLNPSAFLRIGEHSAVRMLDSDIVNTRLELLSGSAAIDCTQGGPGPSLTLVVAQRDVHFLNEGLYRIDSEPPVIRVRTGRAEVASGDQDSIAVDRGMSLRLQAAAAPEASRLDLKDPLADWSISRRQSIMAGNEISQNRPKPHRGSHAFRGSMRTVLLPHRL
jgi:hypothetical protein